MASLPPQDQFRALVKRIQSTNFLINKQLQHICQVNGLRQGGVKAELQKRIIDALSRAYAQDDPRAYREIEQSIWLEKNQAGGYTASNDPFYATVAAPSNAQSPTNMTNYNYTNGHSGYGGYNGQRAQATPAQGMLYPSGPESDRMLSGQGFIFHPSPFYQVMKRVGQVHVCEVMTQHRNCAQIQLKAQDDALLSQCVADKAMRVMVFCAAANTGAQDIAFPHQSELKVNGGEVKANLRGLKNKPGSTRPVDITDLLRLKIPSYTNNVEFTYALTNKAGDKASQIKSQKYYLVVNICKITPVESLVRTIGNKKISKSSVIHELTRKANDADIELSSQVLSLKCPLSYMRLVTPCRASTCTHVQCFDATSYLQLQQQGPQWLCPVCNKPAPYDRLAIDDYVKDILDNTAQNVEKVDIEPNGRWKAHGAVEEEVKPEPSYDSFDLDDDDLIISDVSFVGMRNTNTPNTLAPATGTPTPATGASRESSNIPRSGSNKRPREVIDLTLSDDDEPDPPPKRLQYGRPGSAFPSYI